MVNLDLSTSEGQSAFWTILKEENVVYVHFAPPCGTSSLAREIRRKNQTGKSSAVDPKPLRSSSFPDGLPDLSGVDKDRVVTANRLYAFVAKAIVYLSSVNISWSVENPTNSRMWETSFFEAAKIVLADALKTVAFQMCMHGGDRPKKTLFWFAGKIDLSPLGIMCDGKHTHKPWSFSNVDGFATAKERCYPQLLCKRIAKRVGEALLVKKPKESVAELPNIYRGLQPRRGMQELIPEYKQVQELPIVSASMAEEVFKFLDSKEKTLGGQHLQLNEGDKLLGISPEKGVFGPKSCFVGTHSVYG